LLERIQLLRNIGQFDSVNAGAQLPLARLSLVYAENGRGKTTLASIFRSLGTGDPDLVLERHRLGAVNPPHVVLGIAGSAVQFQNGAWPAPMPQIAIFDDTFVAANVCSGVEIAAGHRQNLHELILGAQGVALNATLQSHVTRIEEHNRALTQKSNAIPAAARGDMSVDDFCALAANPDIEAAIGTAERNLAAGRSADAIRQRSDFQPLSLPHFDVPGINALLALQQFVARSLNAALSRLRLLRVLHPANEFIATERRQVLPQRKDFRIGSQGRLKVFVCFVNGAMWKGVCHATSNHAASDGRPSR
jgi:wobble nucleotide-excising tRNase